MRVIAASGLKVPREGDPRDYITDNRAVEVPDSPYYRRRLRTGELLPATESPAPRKRTRDASEPDTEKPA